MPSITRIGDRGDRLLRDVRAVNLGQVRADLPMGQPFRRQGNHQTVDPGQPALPFGDDFRLEAGIAVAGHRQFHRPGLGKHRLGPVPIAGIASITASRVVLLITEVVIELALQGALDHHLGQLAQQPALAGELQPARPGPLGKLAQQLLISRGQLRLPLILAGRHISHWCLLHLRSYTVEITVPTAAVANVGRCWTGQLADQGWKATLLGCPRTCRASGADIRCSLLRTRKGVTMGQRAQRERPSSHDCRTADNVLSVK
jgi:hypothetical protein